MGYTWTDSGEDSTYTFTCVRCHKDFSVTCKLNEKMAYASGVDAQNAFKSLDAFERECIISGQCFDCQEEIFHRPTKMHAKSWEIGLESVVSVELVCMKKRIESVLAGGDVTLVVHYSNGMQLTRN